MAQLRPLHIRSTSPGMVWRISSSKQPGRPAYVTAYEGSDSTGGGFWSCDLLNCRQFRREVEGGRLTRRAVTAAARLLLVEMHAAGAIERKDASPAAGSLDPAAAA